MVDEYYYCLTHKTVEPAEGCKAADRLGPYASADDAQRALEQVAARNEKWDTDPTWNDDNDEDGDLDAEDQSSGWGPFKN